MSIDQKYIAALARHERAAQAVGALSLRIGAAIARCPIEKKHADWSLSNGERAEIWCETTHRTKSHLWMAYNSRVAFGEDFDEDGQEESLQPSNDGCRHCLRAWRLILKRKSARQELGNARRSIRQLGKSAIAALELIA